MLATEVGYTGGEHPSPTYRDLGDHTEAVRVRFDPSVVSYPELLDLFFSSHVATLEPVSRQYESVVFVYDAEQRRLAERERQRRGGPGVVTTRIRPAGPFHPAEDVHQKFYLRRDERLTAALAAVYDSPRAWVTSTAAARLNGWLGAPGPAPNLERLGPALGLGDDGVAWVRWALR